AWIGENNKTVFVNTETDKNIFSMDENTSNEIILDTNKRFRQYLDYITGYTTKERVKANKKIPIT
ncbi:MAG TPA: DUF5611 family protein, partial [Methanocorpusculum sp.]|nr:DUF5611 family protein [Methanocorpusculum sp.]